MSLFRRAIAVTAIVVAPLVLLVAFETSSGFLRVAAVVWGIIGLGIAWLNASSLAHRISELRAFTDRLPDLHTHKPQLPMADDELGELARSLSRMTPRIDEVFRGLATELARREAILASMTEAVVAVDSKLNISFCNHSFSRGVANHPASDGVPLLKVLRDPGLFQLLQSVISSGETVRQRLKISGRDERTYDVYATPLVDNASRGALSILHDITPIERLERTKRDFVANVSHELRTPLATITGYAETLLNGGLEDEQHRQKFVEIIQANSVRLSNIATDLLTLSELEGGRPATEPEPIPVDDVIRIALLTLDPIARLHQVRLHAENIAALEVLGHRLRFEQALLNLIDNAIKFNKPFGEVEISACASGPDKIEISVSDTGIGIPAEDLSRVFERFYRVDKARSRQVGGTGLGLSIVRHAVEQMQGTVTVESELGKGSRFTITLPRYQRTGHV